MACSMYMMDVAANVLLCIQLICIPNLSYLAISSLYLLADALSFVGRISSSFIFFRVVYFLIVIANWILVDNIIILFI